MDIVILDTETTLHSDRESDKASPHDPNNWIVYVGEKRILDGKVILTEMHGPVDRPVKKPGTLAPIAEPMLLVGHNLKFDLAFMKRDNPEWYQLIENGLQLWDTQLAEYILTGQEHKFASLDELTAKYGGELKDSRMKEYWANGISTEDIPKDEIVPYLAGDVENTHNAFNHQVKLALSQGQLPLINCMNDALLSYIEMEGNGMYINRIELDKQISQCHIEINNYNNDIAIYLKSYLEKHFNTTLTKQIVDNINLNSNKHLATLLYGGDFKYTYKEDTGTVYKSGAKVGQKKYKKVVKHVRFPSYNITSPKLTDKGNVVVDEEALSEYLTSFTLLTKLVDKLQRRKLQEKQLSTYLKPIHELVWAHDNCIHHNLNHCLTQTGRLSSSSPNLQNVPREGTSPIKKVFTSRFKHGLIVEADYSQLEVIALAILSGDTQLKLDIHNGIDMHIVMASKIFNVHETAVTKDQRTAAKRGTFALQYGAGAKAIAKQGSITIEEAKELIKYYYRRYPKVKQWQEDNLKRTQFLRESTGEYSPKGIPVGKAKLYSPTNRIYTFKEYDTPDWVARNGTLVGFSPSEIKNYPVQGFATGDIVPMMLGKLFRNVMLKYQDRALMINTVHDSMLFDVYDHSTMKEFIYDLREELAKLPEYMEKYFNLEIDLPFKVNITAGPNWGDQVEVK